MKSTLTWEEFTSAWFELSTPKNPEPGIQKLFAHLKKGSVAKITEYKHRLMDMQKLAIPLTGNMLPDPISKKAIELFTEMTEAITQREIELNEDIQKRHKEVEDELSALRTKNNAAEKTIAKLHEQIDLEATKAEASNKQTQELEKKRHALELQLTEANSNVDKLSTLNTQLSNATTELKAEFKNRLTNEQNHTLDAKKQLTKAQDDKAAADKRNAMEVDALKQSHHEALQAVKDEMAKLNVFYDQQLKARDTKINTLELQCKTVTENLAQSDKDLAEKNSNNETLKSQLAVQLNEVHKLQEQTETLSASLSDSTNTICELKTEKKDLHALLRKIKK